MKEKDGQYMYLVWDGTPDAYYIRGHVSHDVGIGTLIEEGAIMEETEVGQAQQRYGRWSMQGDAPDGCTCVLRDYATAGRGRFKVTMFGVGCFAAPQGEPK